MTRVAQQGIKDVVDNMAPHSLPFASLWKYFIARVHRRTFLALPRGFLALF